MALDRNLFPLRIDDLLRDVVLVLAYRVNFCWVHFIPLVLDDFPELVLAG